MTDKGNFSELEYLLFTIQETEKTVVAPAPFGRDTLVAFVNGICSHALVEHKFLNNVVPFRFSSSDELVDSFGKSIAHSEWFISFRDGSRAFFDFDDDLLILLFNEEQSDLVARILNADELYQAALRELDIVRAAARSAEHVLRFESFVGRALREPGPR